MFLFDFFQTCIALGSIALNQAFLFGVSEKNSSEKKLKLKEKTQTQGNFGKKLKEFQGKPKDDVIVI